MSFVHCLGMLSRTERTTIKEVSSRRTFLQKNALAVSLLAGIALPYETLAATEEIKPFAPREALLPASRCKVWIDKAYQVGSSLTTTETTTITPPTGDQNGKTKQYQILSELDQVLSNRPKLFVNEKPLSRTTTSLTAQITTSVSTANKEQYKNNRSNLSFPNQLAAMLNQADVERQWGMLQSSEAQKEQGNEIRAAFNYYTQQLEFGDSYRLTASQEDRKKMIRNDALPSLTAVITSDLDLRDLYRNQLLTAVDDVRAEVAYQLQQDVDQVDTTDVIDLLSQAHTACSKWFGLIAPQEVQEAMDIVLQE